MIGRLTHHLETQNFLKSSSLFFLTNLFVAGLNYLIVVLVSFQLSDELAAWTALAAIIMIFFSIVRGLTTPIAKEISTYSENRSPLLKSYHQFSRSYIFKLSFLVAALPILFALILWFFSSNSEFSLYFFIGLAIFCYINFSVENQFLLGTLQTKHAIYASLVLGLGRFVLTLALIWFGLGLFALPLGYVLGYLLAILIAKKYVSSFNFETNQESSRFSVKEDLLDSAKILVALFFLATALNVDIILAESLLSFEQADLFAVISNLGQTIFFGSTAFMNMFIVYSTRSKNLRTYWQSILIVSIFSLGAGLIFWSLEGIVLEIFNRSQYAGKGYLIALYSIFIALYNITFVSIHHLISKSKYLPIWFFGMFVLANIILLTYSSLQEAPFFGSSQVLQFIWIDIVTIGLGAVFLVATITRQGVTSPPAQP